MTTTCPRTVVGGKQGHAPCRTLVGVKQGHAPCRTLDEGKQGHAPCRTLSFRLVCVLLFTDTYLRSKGYRYFSNICGISVKLRCIIVSSVRGAPIRFSGCSANPVFRM